MAELGYSPLPPNLVEDDFQAAGRLPGGTEPPPPTPQNCQNPYITGALQPVGGPTVVGTSNPGGSDLTGAGAAVAATGTAHAAAVAAAPSSSSGAATGTATGSAVQAKAKAKKALDPLENPQLAYPRQSALTAAAAQALSGWSAAQQIALWSTVFAIIVVGVPLAVWLVRRRRRAPRASDVGSTLSERGVV
jgi:cobalamin biosynthesis Mg chelatase CobN